MAKGDKFYYENFISCAELSKQAAEYLASCLENFDAANIEKMIERMHEIEHAADLKKHEMNGALAKAFVTPVDREDLDLLSHRLDDVVDLIEEVLQKFYIYNVKQIDKSAVTFAKHIATACGILCEIMTEFEHFKKSKKIRELVIKLNDVEEECDKLFMSSMRAITENSTDAFEAVSWYKIYESLERCADTCEHASECVNSVIMKNT